jgi:hypothetical protein
MTDAIKYCLELDKEKLFIKGQQKYNPVDILTTMLKKIAEFVF